MKLKSVVLALIAAGALYAPASAQSDQPPIVVTAEDVEAQANQFVQQVALAPSDQLYARWDDRICPSVAGVAPSEGQRLIDHIAVRAHEAGLRPGRSGCQRNVVIIFAPDSDVVAREIVSTRRDLMGLLSEDDVQTAGRDALDDFAQTPRAVRWWHVSYTVTSDGERLANTGTNTGAGTGAPTLNANHAAEFGATAGADEGIVGSTSTMSVQGAEGVRSRGSRLGRSTRRDIGFVLVIVDTRRIASLPPAAVADYVAMATLVQVDPSANLSAYPTILNLFTDNAPTVLAMTDWDRAFVRGLYSATRDSATSRQQRASISREIVEELRD